MPIPTIVVVGSLNMDFVVSVDRLPVPGETVLGRDFQMIPGGKGANQACAAGKLASRSAIVRMIGRVGKDLFADHLKASLAAAGVDVSGVHAAKSQPTGCALISVDEHGQNSIVVASGANFELAASDVEDMRKWFHGASTALFQGSLERREVCPTQSSGVARGGQTAFRGRLDYRRPQRMPASVQLAARARSVPCLGTIERCSRPRG